MSHFPSTPHPTSEVRVPARLQSAPTAQGMVVPHVTLAHRDRRRPVWGQLDQARLLDVLSHNLCQVCGQPLTDPVMLFLRPADYLFGIAVEPGLHPECGRYSTQACPMLAGRTDRYNPVRRDTYRACDDPHCHCTRWRFSMPDPREAQREGRPAEAWYQATISLDDYHIVSEPGTDTTPPTVGIDLRHPHFHDLNRLRSAAPGSDDQQPNDLLAVLATLRTLFPTNEDA